MELIYLLLSVLIRISPLVRPLSGVPVRKSLGIGGALSLVSVWLPIIGWVSVVVQRQSALNWLDCQVVEIQSFHGGSTRVEDEQTRERLTISRGNHDVPLRARDLVGLRQIAQRWMR